MTYSGSTYGGSTYAGTISVSPVADESGTVVSTATASAVEETVFFESAAVSSTASIDLVSLGIVKEQPIVSSTASLSMVEQDVAATESASALSTIGPTIIDESVIVSTLIRQQADTPTSSSAIVDRSTGSRRQSEGYDTGSSSDTSTSTQGNDHPWNRKT